MRINRRVLSIVLCLVLIAVFSLTIAYAALNAVLNISGNANVTASDWSLKIEKLDIMSVMSEEDLARCSSEFTCVDNYIYFGDVTIEKFPVVSGTSIKDFAFSLTKPGDEVYLAFKVTNNGTIPAKLSSITNSIPHIESSNNNTSDVIWGETNIVFNGNMWKNFSSQFPVDSILCPGDAAQLQVYLIIPEDVKTIPSSGLIISNLETKIVFEQVDKSVCSN